MDDSYCRIPLSQDKFAMVSPYRFEELSKFKWYACWNPSSKTFEARRNLPRENGKRSHVKMHRQIKGLKKGDAREVDHWNHDGLDNRDDNLRVCTHAQNGQNKRKIASYDNPYKGVTKYVYRRKDGVLTKFKVQILVQGKKRYLGLFWTALEGAIRYDQEAVKEFGEFAHLNFPSTQPTPYLEQRIDGVEARP